MEHFEYIIVGAGPAGLQMAYFMERGQRKYLAVEAAPVPGAFFQTQPRHRQLLSLNKRFNGFPEHEFNMRHDWNSLLSEEGAPLFRDYSQELYPNADDYVRYLAAFAEQHRLRVRYNTRVASISRDVQGRFAVSDTEGNQWTCDRVIMGTGACAPFVPPEIDGIQCAAGYEDHDLDPAVYENKTVLIIGRGNSALEVANHLAGHAAIIHVAIGNRPIQLAWETHYAGHIRSINNTMLEMFHVKALHGALGLCVRKLRRSEDGGYDVVAEEEVPHWREPGMLELQLHYDHVIRCTGFKYVTPELFSDEVRPASCKKNKYPMLDSMWQSSVPDVYYVGTAMGSRDKQAASSFIHGFRYNVRSLFRLLEHRYHGKELPNTEYPLQSAADLQRLAAGLLERLSNTAALYQQFGVLCDVLLFQEGRCTVFHELPVAYALEQARFTTNADIIVVNFEYGFKHYPHGTNALSFITQSDEASSRRCAAFLHPVFRHYRNGQLVEEDNLGDSLTLRYSRHRVHNVIQTDEPITDDVERNTVMNIINRVSKTTSEVYSETAHLVNHAFRPWPKDRPLDTMGLPRCPISEPEAAE